jgi:small subunit ribosomal protein S9
VLRRGVRIYPGADSVGQFTVNDKDVSEYFPRFGDHQILSGPLAAADLLGKMDVTVQIEGGGITGQTSAVRLGLARALVEYDENCAVLCALAAI